MATHVVTRSLTLYLILGLSLVSNIIFLVGQAKRDDTNTQLSAFRSRDILHLGTSELDKEIRLEPSTVVRGIQAKYRRDHTIDQESKKAHIANFEALTHQDALIQDDDRTPTRLSANQQIPAPGTAAEDEPWTVHEDLTHRDGRIVLENAKTRKVKVFPRRSEAKFFVKDARHTLYGGLDLPTIGLSRRDLLADTLLSAGEPDEQAVRQIIPPLDSEEPRPSEARTRWSNFVGNVEANDNVALYESGRTKGYQPAQYFPQLLAVNFSRSTYEGLLGGWLPVARTVSAINQSHHEAEYIEVMVFGDTDVSDPFVVQTWHRTQHVRNGTAVKTVYGHSYPEFPRSLRQPSAAQFYKALYRLSEYWEARLSDMSQLTLPDTSWVDLTRYAFVKELLVRAGGIQPKYGAIDRDYYGNEYDGFQDTFTSSLSANLEWGRFSHTANVIDNYFTLFVGKNGSINMRGPEVGQYGLMLSLLSKYALYSGDSNLLSKHKVKIVGLARLLILLHDESLSLKSSDPGYGLLHGWSESDAALRPTPDTYWQPYFANSALAIRGLRDISKLDIFQEYRKEWQQRASTITNRTIQAVQNSIFPDTQPPYVPPLPGTNLTFRQSMAQEKPSPQDWPHRLYAELLHAAVLPSNLTNMIHDTMRNYGATSVGVVANVGIPYPQGRNILGFISYGYALSLLLQNRPDEFVLFLYTHRYHVHTRGAWTAGEVTDIDGERAIFCIPAQLTIPSIMRWALVLEHPDDEILYLGRGVPRAWLASGQQVGIWQAPTRWGRVDFTIQYLPAVGVPQGPVFGNASSAAAAPGPSNAKLLPALLKVRVVFGGKVPANVEVKLRMPKDFQLSKVLVNERQVLVKDEAVLLKLNGTEKILSIEGR